VRANIVNPSFCIPPSATPFSAKHARFLDKNAALFFKNPAVILLDHGWFSGGSEGAGAKLSNIVVDEHSMHSNSRRFSGEAKGSDAC